MRGGRKKWWANEEERKKSEWNRRVEEHITVADGRPARRTSSLALSCTIYAVALGRVPAPSVGRSAGLVLSAGKLTQASPNQCPDPFAAAALAGY